jgi:hypothetical protein
MNRGALSVLAVLAAAVGAAAQEPDDKPITLTVQPAAAPEPSLKYRLLPDITTLVPGNAVVFYYRAFSPETLNRWRSPKISEDVEKWRHTPPKDLPRQEVAPLVNSYPFTQLDLGARRRQCDWQLEEEARKEGVALRLPDVHSFRNLGSQLAVRARLEIAEGHFDRAVYTLQTGFALARHLGEGPTLIHSLVGLTLAHAMAEQVEALIQQPGAPNLYWALTDLPRPFASLRRPLGGEKLLFESLLPSLHELEAGPVPLPRVQEQMDHALQSMGLTGAGPGGRQPNWEQRLIVLGFVTKFYPEAKRFLIAEGRPPEEVEAMPALQAVLLYSVAQYYRLRDDMFRWADLPYWQAEPGLRRAEDHLRTARATMSEGIPFASLFLPAVWKVFFTNARLDRRIAALRCVEAVRLYAASHEGNLPGRLSEITDVPIPEDPITGKEFGYHVAGGRATLSAPGVGYPDSVLHYELTLTPSK